jgi:small subunit ribosomal protein S20
LAGKSAEKKARGDSRRQQRNKSIRSQVKTNITRAEKLIFTGEMEAARGAVAEAVSSLDKAAEKKIIHDNNAARRKARLLKKLNKATASPAGPPAAKKAKKAG